MFSRYLSFGFTCIFAFSCSSINIRDSLNIDLKEDWLMPNGSHERTNISVSDYPLDPPYKLVWDYSTDASYPSNSIVISDGLLFLSNLKGEVFAINVNTGSKAGSFSASSPSSVNGSLIYGNSLIVTYTELNENCLIHYDILTGNEKWNFDLGWVKSTPVLSGSSLFIANMNGTIYNVNIESRKIEWEFTDNTDNKSNQFAASPSLHNNAIYIGNINGSLYSVNSSDGKLIWKFNTGNSVLSPPSVYEDKIFFASDDLHYYCIDTSGTLIWKVNLGTKSVSSTAFDSNNAIVSGIDGAVYSFDINTGKLNWKFQAGGTIWASPLVHKKKVFIGSFDENIYCLNAVNGEILWQYKTDGKVRSNIVIWKDLIFACSDDKNIYCFRSK